MLEGQNFSYSRGPESLLSNLSFYLEKGERLIVRGPNGSGKSTLLRMIAGLIPPARDSLRWDKKTITNHTLNEYQQDVLYIGHKLALYPDAFIKDQLKVWQNVSRETLQQWGLESFVNKRISHLSQGQQKRLSLSRCSWVKRPLWILDEPHAGLDDEGKAILNTLMDDHLSKGGLIVLATHNKEFVCKKEISL